MLRLVNEDAGPHAHELRRALARWELASTRLRGDVARGLGLSDEEMLVLLQLWEHGGSPQAQLTAYIGLSRSGTGALIQRLERAGMVERRPDPADKRVRVIRLSERSAERLARAYEELTSELDRLLAQFTPAERSVVGRFVGDLADAGAAIATGAAGAAEPAAATVPRPIWRQWG